MHYHDGQWWLRRGVPAPLTAPGTADLPAKKPASGEAGREDRKASGRTRNRPKA